MLLHAPDVAIDLGTANTRVFAAGRGLLAETPSVIGDAYHPMRRGVIVDIGAAVEILAPLLGRVRRLASKPRVLACIPGDANEEEHRALRQATRAAGASEVAIVPEPLAAMVGAGLDIASEYAQMLVDLGDGVTDIAVIRSGALIHTDSLRVGCSDLRDAVIAAGENDDRADEAMRALCSAPFAHGSALVADVLDRIATFVHEFVHDLPHGVAVEVIESGICATGGGARLSALTDLIHKRSGVSVNVAADPLHAVIRGAGRMLTGPGAKTLWIH